MNCILGNYYSSWIDMVLLMIMGLLVIKFEWFDNRNSVFCVIFFGVLRCFIGCRFEINVLVFGLLFSMVVWVLFGSKVLIWIFLVVCWFVIDCVSLIKLVFEVV